MSDERPTEAKPLPVTTIALGAAALVATVAVGAAVLKRSDAPAPPKPAAEQQQPDIGAMITQLEARLKANPDDHEGWRMLAWSFFETGRFAESATAYRRAAQLKPDNAEYWSALGEALVLAGKGDVPPDAKAAFTTALARNPDDPRARYFLGVAKDMAGDHKGAIEDWFALLAITPAGAPWEADLKRIITEVGAKEKIEVASRLAAVKPRQPVGGAAIAAQAIPGPSPEQMRSAAQLPPGQQQAMVKGMVDGLEAKLATDPAQPDRWIMLMRSRMTLGEAQKAGEALKKGLAANPSAADRLKSAARELGVPGA